MANFYTDNKDLKFQLTNPLMQKIAALKENNYQEAKIYDIAPVDYEDAIDTYDKVLEIIGEICGDIIAPNAESVDHDGPQLINNEVVYAKGTQENMKALTDAKLFGMSLPYHYKGLNFPMVPYVMAAELVSRADAGFANIWGLQDCAETIYEFASDEIKEEYLPRINDGETCSMDLTEPDAGSDLQAVQLKATFDEANNCWRLNGVKRFITNGDANIKLVLARSEEGTTDGRGLSYFVYDRSNKAVKVRRIENKLGIKGSPTCELVFKNAPAKLVGDRKLGLIKYVMSLMNGARLGVGAQSVGLSEAAYREAIKYANEREQFGKSIIKFPAVYELLKNMRAKTDAARAILYETSRFVDVYKLLQEKAKHETLSPEERNESKYYQRMADAFTPLLKLFSSEYANQITYDAIQIHGGTGFMKDFPVERMYRDARILTIYEGTSQLQVVAAIRPVINDTFASKIADYEAIEVTPDLQHLKNDLIAMTQQFQEAKKMVTDLKNEELLDFHARRLVEMVGHIIMGYLLVIDSMRCDSYKTSARIFVRMGKTQNQEKFDFIKTFNPDDLADYKMEDEVMNCEV